MKAIQTLLSRLCSKKHPKPKPAYNNVKQARILLHTREGDTFTVLKRGNVLKAWGDELWVRVMTRDDASHIFDNRTSIHIGNNRYLMATEVAYMEIFLEDYWVDDNDNKVEQPESAREDSN